MTEQPDTSEAAHVVAQAVSRLLPEAVDAGVLYVVSTPIGHLGDISLRAIRVLQAVHRILCEDTRHAHTLLARYGIATATSALHEHNEAQATPGVLAALARGESLALISDAGTPLVSDPGARLVAAAVEAGVRVVPVPGASAALAALVGSGLVPHPCTVLGFLPRKGAERQRQLQWAAACPHAVVLYEAPPRVPHTLADLAAVAGSERLAVVARELTKRFETFQRGTLDALTAYYSESPPRGEVVIVLDGAPPMAAPTAESLTAVASTLRAEGRSARDIMAALMEHHGAARNLAYRLAHDPNPSSAT